MSYVKRPPGVDPYRKSLFLINLLGDSIDLVLFHSFKSIEYVKVKSMIKKNFKF